MRLESLMPSVAGRTRHATEAGLTPPTSSPCSSPRAEAQYRQAADRADARLLAAQLVWADDGDGRVGVAQKEVSAGCTRLRFAPKHVCRTAED